MKYISFLTCLLALPAAAMDQVAFERRSDRTQNFDAIRAYIPVKNQNGTHQEIGLVTFSNNCVLGVHVQPAYRKQGLGAELMAQAVDAIREAGHARATWYASGTIAFFLRMGAKLTELPTQIPPDWRHNADMEFDFVRDGNARENIRKFKDTFISAK